MSAMQPADAAPKPRRGPGSTTELQRRLTAAADRRDSTVKRLGDVVAGTILAQMLPGGAVKGGSMLKLRFGDQGTRATPDLDTAFRGDREAFMAKLRKNLTAGWDGFTGTVVEGEPRAPETVPSAYVMHPAKVKLLYHRKDFKTVDLEIGFDELEATTDAPLEHVVADDIVELFAELGLAAPQPVPVLPVAHQISQKLHACTEPGNDRAHDLVDLQLLEPHASDADVIDLTRRLFRFRKGHIWPSPVPVGPTWEKKYAAASLGLSVLPTAAEAAVWANAYITRLAQQP